MSEPSSLPDRADTLSETLEALRVEGWDDDFEIAGEGIVVTGTDEVEPPQDFAVDREYRFEGASDPGDEAILLAVEHRTSGRRGVLVAAFGPDTTFEEGAVLRALASSSPRSTHH